MLVQLQEVIISSARVSHANPNGINRPAYAVCLPAEEKRPDDKFGRRNLIGHGP